MREDKANTNEEGQFHEDSHLKGRTGRDNIPRVTFSVLDFEDKVGPYRTTNLATTSEEHEDTNRARPAKHRNVRENDGHQLSCHRRTTKKWSRRASRGRKGGAKVQAHEHHSFASSFSSSINPRTTPSLRGAIPVFRLDLTESCETLPQYSQLLKIRHGDSPSLEDIVREASNQIRKFRRTYKIDCR